MTNLRNPKALLLILFSSTLTAVLGCGESEPSLTTDEVTIDELPSADGGANIRGLLVDQGTKKTLSGTRVQLLDSQGRSRETMTTQAGVFEFKNLPSGERFTVVVDVDDYEKHEAAVSPIGAGETETITVNLVAILKLEELPPGDGLSVGAKAPDFNLKDGDGKAHSLANYAGKQRVVLLLDRGAW